MLSIWNFKIGDNIDNKNTLRVADLVFVKDQNTSKSVPGVVVGDQEKISGIGYVVPVLTYEGIKNILRENIVKKDVSKL